MSVHAADTNVSFLAYFAIDLRRLPIYVLFIIFRPPPHPFIYPIFEYFSLRVFSTAQVNQKKKKQNTNRQQTLDIVPEDFPSARFWLLAFFVLFLANVRSPINCPRSPPSQTFERIKNIMPQSTFWQLSKQEIRGFYFFNNFEF